MRGIVLGLLMTNLLYLTWQFFVPAPATVVRQNAVREELPNTIALLSELDEEALIPYNTALQQETSRAAEIGQVGPTSDPVDEESDAERGPELVEVSVPALYCAEIGPFRDESDASAFIASNQGRMSLRLETRQVDAAPDYRVFIPPFASRELASATMDALRSAFKTNNLAIDTFLIPRGELANGIALGLFSEQRNALNVQEQLERLGYNVVVRTEEKHANEVWLYAENVLSEAEFMGHWAQMKLSRSYIDAGEKACETIALP